MNKNISADRLLSAGIVMILMIIAIWNIFSGMNKTENRINPPTAREATKEKKDVTEAGYVIPKNIFPTDIEAGENLKSQIERQKAINKAFAEREQIALEVRANVEASSNGQPVLTAEEVQPSGTASQPATGQSSVKGTPISAKQEMANMMLQKIRIDKFKHKELFIHH